MASACIIGQGRAALDLTEKNRPFRQLPSFFLPTSPNHINAYSPPFLFINNTRNNIHLIVLVAGRVILLMHGPHPFVPLSQPLLTARHRQRPRSTSMVQEYARTRSSSLHPVCASPPTPQLQRAGSSPCRQPKWRVSTRPIQPCRRIFLRQT